MFPAFCEHTDILWLELSRTSDLEQPSSNLLSKRRPATGWPYKFLSEGTQGAPVLFQAFGHCRGGMLILFSGHSFSGSFNNLGASIILT